MPDAMMYTQGGPAFQGDFQGHYVHGDQIVLIQGYNGEELEQTLAQVQRMLAGGQAVMQASLGQQRLCITAPGAPAVVLSEQAALDLLPAAARQATEQAYLAALVVNPRYGRWASRFVPLAGMLSAETPPEGWSDLPPEFRLLQEEGEGAQRRIQRIPLEDITQALEMHPALALLGEPGAGKSTCLERLALQAAQKRLSTGQGRIPLLLPLADFRDHANPYEYAAARWQYHLGKDADLGARLRKGEVLLLCDALNEMPFSDLRDYRRRVAALRTFTADWPGNAAVFTCRSRDYSEPLGLPQVEIQRLDDRRVQDFLGKYLPPELAASAWERLSGSALLELMRNPYYLNMLAYLLRRGGGWPASRAALFMNFGRALLGREEGRNPPDWPGCARLENALSALAAHMQGLGEGTRLPRPQACQALARAGQAQAEGILRFGLAATLLDVEPGPGDQEQVRFYHHQLQEYFAAAALLARFQSGAEMDAYWRQPALKQEMPAHGALASGEALPPPPTTGWEEPTLLAAGLAASAQNGALEKFLEAVLQINPPLAARCLGEAGLPPLPGLRKRTQQALLQRLGDPAVHLRARLAAGDALGPLGDPRFEELALEGVRLLLPPLVSLPGGSFHLGSPAWEVLWLQRRGFPVQDERPRHPVQVDAFQIGRFPVTNAEFACFVHAGGYQEEQYWPTPAAQAWRRGADAGEGPESDLMDLWQALQDDRQGTLDALRRAGRSQDEMQALEQMAGMDEAQMRGLVQQFYGQRTRLQPAFWEDERFNASNQPVVGVTWYEALAYCAWLETQLQRAGRLAPGMQVRLPGEHEWEYAARRGGLRPYPWGWRFDPDCANTYEGHVLRPSPVGVYPRGASVDGIHDLSGSVWEWTHSLYQPYPLRPAEARQSLAAEGRRVVRGGSWYFIQWNARCAYRDRFIPAYFNNLLGFRVVLSLARSEC